MRVQQGYSGGGWEDLSRKHKKTQKLVNVFYIYCNIEPLTSTT